jgi:hypothetical protein
MMVDHGEQPHRLYLRRVPIADHARRDLLDVLRGDLPPMELPTRPRGGPVPLLKLYLTGVARGLGVGAGTGAIAGTLLLPILGTGYGAAVGLVVAAPVALVLAGGIVAVALCGHRPLRDTRRFHRQIWAVLLLGVEALDVVAVVGAVGSSWDVPWKLGAAALAVLTAVVVGFLRPAARRLVVAYASASGWRLTFPQGLFPPIDVCESRRRG